MAEQLCELLGMKVDSFLRLTEVHVLPYLVLTRKRDIISRIGASRDDSESPFDVCSEKNNLAAILAFLLAQESKNPEAMIMSLLAEIDAAFKGRTLAELVRIEPILIACDLLKSLGDAGEQNKERVSIQPALLYCLEKQAKTCTGRVVPSSLTPSGHLCSPEVCKWGFIQEGRLTESIHRGACSWNHYAICKCNQRLSSQANPSREETESQSYRGDDQHRTGSCEQCIASGLCLPSLCTRD